MRFVHTADWQLGMTRRFLGGGGDRPGEAQARFAADRLEAVRALGALADAEGAAFVLVCGDVFESNLVGAEVVARTCEALRSFTTPVLLLPGNHDPADAASVLRRRDFARRCPDHVTVLDRPGVHAVDVPGACVEVVAAPWFSKRPLADLVAAAVADLAPPPPGTVRVVAGHGELDVLSPDPDDPKVLRYDALRAAVDDGRVHYVALGDRHSTWSDGTGRVRYPGAPEVTAHLETAPGNVLLVDVTPTAVEAHARHVGRWRFVAHEAGVDTDDDVDALDAWLDTREAKERTAVRLTLTGVLTLRQRTRLDALLEAHRPVFAAVEVHEGSRLVTRPDDDDLASLALTGFAAAAAAELHGAAGVPVGSAAPVGAGQDADEARSARDALALLHRLVSAG